MQAKGGHNPVQMQSGKEVHMNIVTREKYYEVLREFFDKHVIINVETSPMVNNDYHKTYHCEDGICLYENNRIVTEEVDVKVKGVKAKATVRLWETEIWSDEFPSMYLYEQVINE